MIRLSKTFWRLKWWMQHRNLDMAGERCD
ncbi:hypothetical protein ANCCAN_03757 [Ancylostoma caninum]|uniref:Uncharacterized protein n=1 Tax=Ancylostoma caninum TaxID=29170 RepID=A0A368H0K2_ANCCA|nr:hypothetical protein ANCCAN_03757 [Ancylostoma caninum]